MEGELLLLARSCLWAREWELHPRQFPEKRKRKRKKILRHWRKWRWRRPPPPPL